MKKSVCKKESELGTPLFTAKDSGLTFTIATVCVLIVSLVFSVVVSSMMTASGLAAEEFYAGLDENFVYKLFSYLLSSVAMLATVCAVSYYKRQKPFVSLPFKATGVKYYLMAPALAFGLLFGFGELNNIFVGALEKIGLSSPPVTLPNEEWWQYAVWIVVVAILPAVLEESVFRGYILEGLKGQSTLFITLAGGLVFSLFHQNPQQTPYQFICGAAYFLFAVKCGSMYPVILMHFLNNFAIITSDYFGWAASPTLTLVLTIAGLAVFAACIIYLVFFDKSKAKKADISDGRNDDEADKNPVKPAKKEFFIYAAIGLMICAVIWVSQFFS